MGATKKTLVVLLLLSSCWLQGCEAHIFEGLNLKDAIIGGIKKAFWGMVNGIVNGVKSATMWAANKIKDSVSSVATDMFSALSKAGEGVKERANATLSEIVGSFELNQTAALLKMMHTGPLPPEYYFRKIDLEAEIAFLDELVDMIRIMTIVGACVLSFCVLCMLVLFCCYCMTKSDMARVDELEEETTKKLAEEEMKRKLHKKKEADERSQKRKEFLALLMQGGGPRGFAAARPPPGLY